MNAARHRVAGVRRDRAHQGARVAVAAIGILLTLASAGPAGAQDTDDQVQFTATVGGRPLAQVDANDPLTLSPDSDVVVTVKVHNPGARPVTVRAARLQSKVGPLSLFDYTARLDMVVPPGGTGQRRFGLDLGDLATQATGILPARFELLAPDRSVLATDPLHVDVRGSLRSVYGFFGIAIALVTGFLAVTALLRLFLDRLPGNRWSRAVPFAVIGIGIGLTLTFSMSTARLLSPTGSVWLTFIALGGLLGLLFGLVTPGPGGGGDEADETDDMVALARETARRSRASATLAGAAGPAVDPPAPSAPNHVEDP